MKRFLFAVVTFFAFSVAAANATYIPGVPPANVAQTQVSVPALTDTTIIAANPSRRSLAIFVQTSNSFCYLAFDTAASAGTGLILGQGSLVGYAYTWGAGDPPPKNAIHVYCSSAATVVVWEGT